MVNPIHVSGTPENDGVQHVDVRLYFDRDLDREHLLDCISNALQSSADLCDLVSAYELTGDGFGRLVPNDRPLA